MFSSKFSAIVAIVVAMTMLYTVQAASAPGSLSQLVNDACNLSLCGGQRNSNNTLIGTAGMYTSTCSNGTSLSFAGLTFDLASLASSAVSCSSSVCSIGSTSNKILIVTYSDTTFTSVAGFSVKDVNWSPPGASGLANTAGCTTSPKSSDAITTGLTSAGAIGVLMWMLV